MTKKQLAIYCSFLFSLFLNGYFIFNQKSGQSNPSLSSGQVVRIIDGDTFDLQNSERIRLAGADAPEYPKGCLSQEAKNRLEELLLGKEVSLEPVAKDNFGRQVAYVFQNNLSIDEVLVQEGLAEAVQNNPSYDPRILTAQEQSQKTLRGIWSSVCQAKKDCSIKGNYRSDKNSKIYHLPECYNYPKIVIRESDGDQWFCSEAEAQAAGFTLSKDCPEK